MNRLFVFLGLVLGSMVLVNCAPKFYLEPMCKNEVFDFEDQKVNAFYRVELNYTLRNLSQLLLPEDLKFETWSNNDTEVQLLYKTKNQFNKLMEDFYNRQTIDRVDSSVVYLHKKAIFRVWDLFSSFKGRVGFGESSSLYTIDSTIKAAAEFFHDIMSLKSDLLAPNLIKKDDLKVLIVEIERIMEIPVEQFVFENHASHFYYNKRILQMKNFIFDTADFTAQALFTVFIPVHSKDTTNSPTYPCRKAKLLPAFYNQL